VGFLAGFLADIVADCRPRGAWPPAQTAAAPAVDFAEWEAPPLDGIADAIGSADCAADVVADPERESGPAVKDRSEVGVVGSLPPASPAAAAPEAAFLPRWDRRAEALTGLGERSQGAATSPRPSLEAPHPPAPSPIPSLPPGEGETERPEERLGRAAVSSPLGGGGLEQGGGQEGGVARGDERLQSTPPGAHSPGYAPLPLRGNTLDGVAEPRDLKVGEGLAPSGVGGGVEPRGASESFEPESDPHPLAPSPTRTHARPGEGEAERLEARSGRAAVSSPLGGGGLEQGGGQEGGVARGRERSRAGVAPAIQPGVETPGYARLPLRGNTLDGAPEPRDLNVGEDLAPSRVDGGVEARGASESFEPESDPHPLAPSPTRTHVRPGEGEAERSDARLGRVGVSSPLGGGGLEQGGGQEGGVANGRERSRAGVAPAIQPGVETPGYARLPLRGNTLAGVPEPRELNVGEGLAPSRVDGGVEARGASESFEATATARSQEVDSERLLGRRSPSPVRGGREGDARERGPGGEGLEGSADFDGGVLGVEANGHFRSTTGAVPEVGAPLLSRYQPPPSQGGGKNTPRSARAAASLLSLPAARPSPASPTPRVSIGTLEIIITAPERPAPAAAPEPPSNGLGESLASRFYLRSVS
jgi:hypothetical protein